MVELKNIHKYFPANNVTALDGADFNLREGEIHALLGENGAGKSTLMHIMAGFIKPGTDSFKRKAGSILINGKEQRFSSPAQALAAGIGMVRQHPRQIPGLLVWENCIVGNTKHPFLHLNRRSCRKKVSALNDSLGFDLPLDIPAEKLNVSQGQKAAILGLVLRNIKYLIFDEPAAVLSPEEKDKLFTIFSALRREGKGIVLISHKLEEAKQIANRITVLRQGKTRISGNSKMFSEEKLIASIFGEQITINKPGAAFVTELSLPSDPVLFLQNFSVHVPGCPLIRGINLHVDRGLIMGIMGMRDGGLETFELALTCFLPFSGTVQLNGKLLNGKEQNTAKRVKAFRIAGGAYLGTKNAGLMLSIEDLLLIHAHRRFNKWGILHKRQIKHWVRSIMDAAKIPHRINRNSSTFSGGQLQRLLLTREMGEHGALLVLSEPGHGLDRLYKKRLAALLREKAKEQTAIVIFSADMEELLELCDCITVLRDGVISGMMGQK